MSTSSWLMKNGYLRKCLLKKITVECPPGTATDKVTCLENLRWYRYFLIMIPSLRFPWIFICWTTVWFHSIVINCVSFLCRQLDWLITYTKRKYLTLHHTISRFPMVFSSHTVFVEKCTKIAAYGWKNQYENRLVWCVLKAQKDLFFAAL